ncbi:MAG: proline racemase family protein [Candidatus Hodarchaeota archaeon]
MYISSGDLTEISYNPMNPKATAKNVTIFGDGKVDRSPCGTGTSAKMVSLYSKGNFLMVSLLFMKV